MSIFGLNGLLMQVGEGIVRPIGQTSARWQVLGRAFEPRTVSQMARDMGHARQGVQRVADVLVKEGLIAYKPHPTDQRTKLLELTPQGMKVLTAIHARQLAWSEQVTTSLNQEQLAGVVEALENIAHMLDTQVSKQSRR